MGTRNLTMAYSNGEYKVAQYGQWDGYPQELGIQLLNFLKKINIDALRKTVNNCTYLSEEDIKEINHNIDATMTDNPRFSWQEFYPELSRDTGGDILNWIVFKGKTRLRNSLTFAADSLFCEWGYVVDLDKNTFEVYKGSTKTIYLKMNVLHFSKKNQKRNGKMVSLDIIRLNLLSHMN